MRTCQLFTHRELALATWTWVRKDDPETTWDVCDLCHCAWSSPNAHEYIFTPIPQGIEIEI